MLFRSITWKIENMDRRTADGFVTTAHWRATAQDGDHSASVYGSCGWGEGELNIPYGNLTEQDVLGWCWASVDKDAVESGVTENLAAQLVPVQQQLPLPWAQS